MRYIQMILFILVVIGCALLPVGLVLAFVKNPDGGLVACAAIAGNGTGIIGIYFCGLIQKFIDK